MWGVDPALRCEQHSLGEHAELHQEVGTLLNHPHGEAIVRATRRSIRSTRVGSSPATTRWPPRWNGEA